MPTKPFKPQKFGKFILTKKIAVGGMAEIYKAEAHGVDGFKKVAVVKRILPHCSADKDFITMLIDEAKLSVLLSHTNIVQVYELGKVDDDYYISMEYIHGVNLRDVLYRARESGVKVPEDISVYIISEICKGLDYAHRKTDENNKPLGIIHRDISPQNILISYEGEVKVGDFGIAKAAMNISHTMAGVLKGKIAYMSPEQALGKSLDHRTDIFSTGILLYELLTNKRLYTGESQFEVLKMIRESRIREQELPADIPNELRHIVAKALAYDRENRYSNAGDMQTDLIRYLYSRYPDFTPRKLSDFIRTMFSDLLEAEKTEKTAEAKYESLTSTFGGKGTKQTQQIDIVAAPEELTSTTHRSPQPAQVSKHKVEKRLRGRRFLSVTLLSASLAILGYGALKFYPTFQKNILGKQKPIDEKQIIPELAYVRIDSEPSGAAIIIDGQNTGLSTPAILSDLEVGKTYVLRLELKGYKPLSRTLKPISTEQVDIAITLERITGSINITSIPAGAQIFINGNDTGKRTPAILDGIPLDEDQTLSIRLAGYEDYEQVIKLTTEKEQKLTVELKAIKPVTASIQITSIPAGASIALDGVKTGKTTPAEITDVSEGKHTVSLELEGYKTWIGSVSIIGTKKHELNATLVKLTQPVQAAGIETKPPEEDVIKTGSLRVTSNPPGALIYLDGKNTGKTTPATIAEVTTGTRRVTLELQGYKVWSGSVKITANKTAFIKGTLTTIEKMEPVVEPSMPPPVEQMTGEQKTVEPEVKGGMGKIKIASRPSGADVFVNAIYSGKTPITVTVPSGNNQVIVNKEGLMRFVQTVNVKPNQTVDLTNIELEDLFGEVNVASVPPRADIIFDGQKIPPKTPVTIRKVRRDQVHTITVIYEGYKPWTKSFKLTDKTLTINAILER